MSARSWEVVVKRRFLGFENRGSACAWAILWRQGRHTDPNGGSWNSERFMFTGACVERVELSLPRKDLGCYNYLVGHRSGNIARFIARSEHFDTSRSLVFAFQIGSTLPADCQYKRLIA